MDEIIRQFLDEINVLATTETFRCLELWHLGLDGCDAVATPVLFFENDSNFMFQPRAASRPLPSWSSAMKEVSRPHAPRVRTLVRVARDAFAAWLQTGQTSVGLIRIEMQDRFPPRSEALESALRNLARHICSLSEKQLEQTALGINLILSREGELLYTSKGVSDFDRMTVQSHVAKSLSASQELPHLVLGPLTFQFTHLEKVGTSDPVIVATSTSPPWVPLLPHFSLTPRQRQIAELTAQGLKLPEIAEMLGSNVRALRCHLTRVYQILGVENRLELKEALLLFDTCMRQLRAPSLSKNA